MVIKTTNNYYRGGEGSFECKELSDIQARVKTASVDGSPVHHRLYARSQSRQNEGREIREQIEMARKMKMDIPIKRILPEEAENLYGRLYADFFKKQKEQEAIEKELKEKLTLNVRKGPIISEKSAKHLFNRLYEEKTASLAMSPTDELRDKAESNSKFSGRIISQKSAEILYDRLFKEQTSSRIPRTDEESAKSSKSTRLISKETATRLFDRLHKEKTTSMKLVTDQRKRNEKRNGRAISKQSAEKLFSRLSSGKTLSMKVKNDNHEYNDLSSRASRASSSGVSAVHQRLYARSQSRQNEGREKREQIKMKRKVVEKKPTRKMSEKSAKELFNRLYKEKTTSYAAKQDPSSSEEFSTSDASRLVISQSSATQLFDRLYGERNGRTSRTE